MQHPRFEDRYVVRLKHSIVGYLVVVGLLYLIGFIAQPTGEQKQYAPANDAQPR